MAMRKKVSADRYSMVPRADVGRSAFDTSYIHKTTFDAGFLIPIYVEEILPGDSFRVKMTAFCRAATPLTPVMDNLYIDSFFFFVPNRLVWSNWERFMGEQQSPSDTTVFLTPQVEFLTVDLQPESVGDYFGITVNNIAAQTLSVLAFPFRGMNLIWNEWFRDEDLQSPATVELDDGPDPASHYVLQPRNKRRDYFTSARPWPQKPVQQDTLSAIGGYPANYIPGGNMAFGVREYGVGAPVTGIGYDFGAVGTGPTAFTNSGSRDITRMIRDGADAVIAVTPTGVADIRVMVNDMRTADMIQRMMERDARGGTRYSEKVEAHFGVRNPDQRLQRPEYLGGGRTPVQISPVASTTESTNYVLGELAGIGSAVVQNHGFSSSFTEHGFVLGFIDLCADVTYQNGVHRMWFRRTQYDFYWPGLAHLGEQAVFQKEIFCTGVEATDDGIFGYQERWSEYRQDYSRISCMFRSNFATPLDMWHLAQNYAPGAPPTLAAHITPNIPIARTMQVATLNGQQFLLDALFDCRKVRALPMFSVPGMQSKF